MKRIKYIWSDKSHIMSKNKYFKYLQLLPNLSIKYTAQFLLQWRHLSSVRKCCAFMEPQNPIRRSRTPYLEFCPVHIASSPRSKNIFFERPLYYYFQICSHVSAYILPHAETLTHKNVRYLVIFRF